MVFWYHCYKPSFPCIAKVRAVTKFLVQSQPCFQWLLDCLRWFGLCTMASFPAESSLQKIVHCGHQRHSFRLWHLNNAQLILKGPKSVKKISPTPLSQHHQPEALIQSTMHPCFQCCLHQFLTLPFECHSRNWIETHQTKQHFSNLLWFNFGEPMQNL